MTRRKDVLHREERGLHRGEQGITGIETAIILIAFVVVASVFAFVILSTGLFSADRSRETVLAGLAKTRGSMEISGSVVATSDGTEITDITFDVALAAGGSTVDWNPSSSSRTIVSYIDESIQVNSLTYTTTVVVGDADFLLEPGELFEITLASIDATVNITENETFTLQVQPPSGATLVIQRTLPGSISDTIIDLN